MTMNKDLQCLPSLSGVTVRLCSAHNTGEIEETFPNFELQSCATQLTVLGAYLEGGVRSESCCRELGIHYKGHRVGVPLKYLLSCVTLGQITHTLLCAQVNPAVKPS